MTKKNWRREAVLIILAALFLLPACSKDKPKAAPPPPTVTVAPPVQKEVVNYIDFTGNSRAVESVEIRARVQGFLESKHFNPGDMVKKGDLLFVIDPKPFEAKLNQAKAELATAHAQLKLAEATLIRKKNAFKDKAVSEVEVLTTQAEVDKAKASIEGAKAAVTNAEIDLSYTKIHAPLSGQITRNLVDPGNLVGRSDATLLATVYQLKPIHVYFSVAEYDILYALEKQREQTAPRNAEGDVPVFMGLANEKGFPHRGYGDYMDPTVDPGTGTIQVRAVFANQKGIILPGLFVRVRIPMEKVPGALLVPESALAADQGGRYLLVVDDQNVVQFRRVKLGLLHDGLREVREGVKAGERVVINGLQRARPGAKVTPLTKEEAAALAKKQDEKLKAAAQAKAKEQEASSDQKKK